MWGMRLTRSVYKNNLMNRLLRGMNERVREECVSDV